jgi:uncharacterized RDD family membrane protein YckC
VKCPKCNYLGFETGDTCKNCGYDFSLIAGRDSDPIDIDLDLKTVDSDLALVPDWPDELREFAPQPELEPPPEPIAATRETGPPLPLFTPSFTDDDDEPLIKLPAAPRPPLAVRRTPDTPRLRVVPKPLRSAEAAPALAFEEIEPEVEIEADVDADAPDPEPPYRASRVWAGPRDALSGAISPAGPRLAAAAIDHVLLGGVDIVVMYFTTRVAGLAFDAWMTLPPAPMIAFLLMLKLSYFAAFTAVGGQTIGKMALRLRVVGEDRTPIDGALAVKRTLAGAVSALTLGLGYIPALFDGERRTLHDRVARTRVVALPSS